MANSIAYGFIGLKDLFPTKVSANPQIVQDAIEDSIAEYERQLDELLDALVFMTTEDSFKYSLPGDADMQPLDQWGNPLPVKPSGNYTVGLPLQAAGIAWGDNRETRAKMTVEKANELTIMVQTADTTWIRRHLLAAIFTNTEWTYVSTDDRPDVVVKPLANGDSVKYVRRGGGSSTDDHYKAQANAIDNSNNPFPGIRDELSEHPSNSGPYVSYIPTNQKTAVMALSTFVEIGDPDLEPGSGTDTVRGSISAGFGDEVLGKADGMWIVEWKSLPDNYIMSVALGASNIVGWREEPEAELQGLIQEFQNVDGNRQLHKFIRKAGFGVVNRVAIVITRIGNGTYAIPTGYQAPLAV